MVYVPQLDRQGFVDRQRINQEANRPTMSRKDAFLQGESDAGRNYATMMDLMKQAERTGGFKSGDPRTDQLKDARRQYNRQDKYNIGEIMGQTPQFMNELYRTNSGVLREYANPTYNAMYPISEMLHRTTGSGGITGMLLNKAFGKTKEAGRGFYQDLRDMGIDILGSVGIGGAVPREEATEEVLQNYADQTFGHPDMLEIAGPVIRDVDRPWKEGEIDIDRIPPRTAVDTVDDIAISDLDPNLGSVLWGMPGLMDQPEVIEGYDTTYIDGPVDDATKYEDYLDRGIESLKPYGSGNREFGILLNQGLVSDPMEELRNRTLQDEYINYIESTGDRLTYDEFKGAWERTHALPKGIHMGEGHITPKWMLE